MEFTLSSCDGLPGFGPLLPSNGCISCNCLRKDQAGAARRSAHARGPSPGRSPGTNSPLDCLCPGLLPRPQPAAGASSFTSLRSMPQRLDPGHGGARFSWQANPGSEPRKSGGQRSEVKGERRAKPVSEECARTQTGQWTVCAWRTPGALAPGMSGVARPASSARASRLSQRIEVPHPALRSGPSRKSAKGRKPPLTAQGFVLNGSRGARWSC
jgi:hypothetical protein